MKVGGDGPGAERYHPLQAAAAAGPSPRSSATQRAADTVASSAPGLASALGAVTGRFHAWQAGRSLAGADRAADAAADDVLSHLLRGETGLATLSRLGELEAAAKRAARAPDDVFASALRRLPPERQRAAVDLDMSILTANLKTSHLASVDEMVRIQQALWEQGDSTDLGTRLEERLPEDCARITRLGTALEAAAQALRAELPSRPQV